MLLLSKTNIVANIVKFFFVCSFQPNAVLGNKIASLVVNIFLGIFFFYSDLDIITEVETVILAAKLQF